MVGGVSRTPKKGDRVFHRSTGAIGIVSSIFRGVINVVYEDGSRGQDYAGSFALQKKGCLGCALFLIVTFAVPLAAAATVTIL